MLKKLSFSKRKTVIEGNILTRSCTEPAFADAENLVGYVNLCLCQVIHGSFLGLTNIDFCSGCG